MQEISVIDRRTGQIEKERVFGGKYLAFFYGNHWYSWILRSLASEVPLFSKLYAFIQKRPSSAKRIAPFVEKYGVDASEFLEHNFRSFNDFFIRRLKPECRPICSDPACAVLPADGRYLVYPDLSQCPYLVVKGKEFSLGNFIRNRALARRYADGSALIARLCPADYHRFHFPCDGVVGRAEYVEGKLHSVNPIALRRYPSIFSENRRMLSEIESEKFGTLLYVEVGATCVGSIHQTYLPGAAVRKGAEKGYFSFGGSSLVILFEKRCIRFDEDFIANSAKGVETYARMGESLGREWSIL